MSGYLILGGRALRVDADVENFMKCDSTAISAWQDSHCIFNIPQIIDFFQIQFLILGVHELQFISQPLLTY